MITREELLSVLSFDPLSGQVSRGGRRAGTLSKEKGYRIIYVCGKLYKEHRLMWFYVHGTWPCQIDHINGVKDDNRIQNLRPSDSFGNQCNRAVQSNNSSGFKGVSFHRASGKWCARIGFKKTRVTLGYFETAEEAHKAYALAAPKYHGEFARVA